METTIDRQMHDLANQLNAMAGAAWLLLLAIEDEAQLYPIMSEIERAVDIMSRMQQLLAGGQLPNRRRRCESA